MPDTQKSTVDSAGPNAERCVGSHDGLVYSMGIAVYGIIDKFARAELNLRAVPEARLADAPPAVYLLTVRDRGGIPLQIVDDKGEQRGELAALHQTLRATYEPHLDLEEFPPHVFGKEYELENVRLEYEDGKIAADYCPDDKIHRGISLWLWAKIVQARLDHYVWAQNRHTIRKQKNVSLPTGGRAIDFYEHPETWGLSQQLIHIDDLIAKHAPPKLFQFGADEMVSLAESLYAEIGHPVVDAMNGWAVFQKMIQAYSAQL